MVNKLNKYNKKTPDCSSGAFSINPKMKVISSTNIYTILDIPKFF